MKRLQGANSTLNIRNLEEKNRRVLVDQINEQDLNDPTRRMRLFLILPISYWKFRFRILVMFLLVLHFLSPLWLFNTDAWGDCY